MSVNREYKGLPKEYWKKQNFCWYMHDMIQSIFQNCIEYNKLTTIFNFNTKIDGKNFKKSEDKIAWMYQNGYKDVADIILGKRIFHAILGDMCNFIYESLNTIEKGKITVSLALLRKPFRDNLLYLEWLLGDPKEIIGLINKQDIGKYAIEGILKEKGKVINIIKNAIDKVGNKEYFSSMNELMFYDIRYNYNVENSLQRVWNKANHLVTTRKHIKSDEFNFVFLDEDLHLDFIDYYYKQVPNLLFYTYNIVIELYNKFIREISQTTRLYNNSLIVFKLLDMFEKVTPQEYFGKDADALLNFVCDECKKIVKINLYSEEFDDFRNGWSFQCPICKQDINICRYTFFEDFKDKKFKFRTVK